MNKLKFLGLMLFVLFSLSIAGAWYPPVNVLDVEFNADEKYVGFTVYGAVGVPARMYYTGDELNSNVSAALAILKDALKDQNLKVTIYHTVDNGMFIFSRIKLVK